MKQPLLSELDKVFPLSHKVQHFCNSSCPTKQNACCCACFCCCTQICLDFRVNLFFFFLFLIFFFLSTARWGFKLLLLCWKGIEICRAFKKEKHSPPDLYLWELFEITVSSAIHPASWKHRVRNSLPCTGLSAETCEVSSFTSRGQLIDGAGFYFEGRVFCVPLGIYLRVPVQDRPLVSGVLCVLSPLCVPQLME